MVYQIDRRGVRRRTRKARTINGVVGDASCYLADDLDMEDTDLDPSQSVLSLGIESISIVYLVSELQQHYGLGNRLFDELRANDRLLKDMTLHDIVETVLKVAG